MKTIYKNKVINFFMLLVIITCLTSCGDFDFDTDANLDSKIEAKIEAKMENKLNIVGADMRSKIADDLRAEFNTQLNTQNTGMFSGGAVYVLALGVFIVASIVFTFIWILKQLFKYKNIWHLISESIEEHAEKEESTIKDVKQKFDTKLQENGLKEFVCKNLKKRGLNMKKLGQNIECDIF